RRHGGRIVVAWQNPPSDQAKNELEDDARNRLRLEDLTCFAASTVNLAETVANPRPRIEKAAPISFAKRGHPSSSDRTESQHVPDRFRVVSARRAAQVPERQRHEPKRRANPPRRCLPPAP